MAVQRPPKTGFEKWQGGLNAAVEDACTTTIFAETQNQG